MRSRRDMPHEELMTNPFPAPTFGAASAGTPGEAQTYGASGRPNPRALARANGWRWAARSDVEVR
jgi:hypothetical protein